MSAGQPRNRFGQLLTWSPALLVGLALLASFLALPYLPDRVPTHWGIDGRPTNAASRGFAAFLLPGVMLHLWLLMWVIGRATTQTAGARAVSRRWLPVVTAATLALMLVMHLALLANGLGWTVSVPRVASVGVGALLALIGFASRDIPPNPVIGLRTPTTLRDPRAWRAGNRAAAKGMMLGGAATMLAAPLPGPWPLLVMLGAPLAACVAGALAARRAAPPEPTNG